MNDRRVDVDLVVVVADIQYFSLERDFAVAVVAVEVAGDDEVAVVATAVAFVAVVGKLEVAVLDAVLNSVRHSLKVAEGGCCLDCLESVS